MSGSKYFDRIAVIVTALILILTILFMNGDELGIKAMEHTVDMKIDYLIIQKFIPLILLWTSGTT